MYEYIYKPHTGVTRRSRTGAKAMVKKVASTYKHSDPYNTHSFNSTKVALSAPRTRPIMSASEDEDKNRPSDVEEGDSLQPEEPFDSSEEEEEDDEEEIQKVRDGFIVDSDEEAIIREKRKKKKSKRRHENKEDEGLLDEDDLDLLMENSGAATQKAKKSKFKRLKRAQVEEEPQPQKGLNDFFSDEEVDDQESSGEDVAGSSSKPSAGRALIDELDDFIEDDEFSDMDEEAREEIRQRRKQERLKPTEITGIDSEKLDELYEIFGDGEDYNWALVGEDDDGEFREDDARPQLHDIYEPEELKARMLTDSDKVIRDTDIPERYQMLRKNISDYDLDEDDFLFEKSWVTHKLMNEKRDLTPDFDMEAFANVISDVLDFICKENLDIPFIMGHRRDHLLKTTISGEGDEAHTDVETLVDEPILWRILQLDVEFHALLAKRNNVNYLLNKLEADDDAVLQEYFKQSRDLTDLQDISDYVTFKYDDRMRDLGLKKGHKVSIYGKVKNDRLMELVKAVGISASDLAENISASSKIYTTVDADLGPSDMAEDICEDGDSMYAKVSQVLDVTKRYYAEQLFTDLRVRKYLREQFTNYARVRVILTEQGRLKIDKNSPYADFKYAINRSQESFYDQPDLFLRMLEAEAEHLVEIKVEHMDDATLFSDLFNFFGSDGASDVAAEWNSFRRDVLNIALKKLIPLVTSTIKEETRRECERLLFFDVRDKFTRMIDQAPFKAPNKESGEIPRVFALSSGNGRFGIDAVVGSVIDENGKVVDTYKFVENPRLSADRIPEGETSFEVAFLDAIRDSRPDVIVMNGFNVNTHKLYKIIFSIIQNNSVKLTDSEDFIPLIYVNDEVAMRYQNSQRAKEEFPDKPSLIRYTIGLARFTQSPLLEYVNLGDEVTALSIHKHQRLLNEDKLKDAIVSAFVDIVNVVGIDINRCVGDSYLAASLKYISGLGERKAFGLLRSVQQHPLFSRQSLITNDNIKIGATIFLNCASFLRIPQSKSRAIRHGDDVEAVTILDDSRIHPEDYSLAEKMAADALDYDEEQIDEMRDAPPGETIIDKLLELEDGGAELLNSLVLEDYSRQLEEAYGKKKRATLQMILEELTSLYGELRNRFKPLSPEEIFETLTGESLDTFNVNSIVPIMLKKVNDFRVFGVTSSRIECTGQEEQCRDPGDRRRVIELFHEGQTVQARVMNIDFDGLTCDVALSPSLIKSAPQVLTYSRSPDIWDVEEEEKQLRSERQIKERQQKAVRMIKHPLFHTFNSSQAQQFLAPKERGAAVIRPSSLGPNHIAITWKVDNNLYQHINVVEHDKENEFSVGRTLYIDKTRYNDLDEILQTYVGEIAKRVDQMTQHDKFKTGSKDDVVHWLEEFSKNNSKRGVYCFAFNYKKPGSFLLLFKTSPDSKINTWNVKATPTGFELNSYNYTNVDNLCNGFKTLIKNQGNKPQTSSRYNGSYNNHTGYGQNYQSNYAGGRF